MKRFIQFSVAIFAITTAFLNTAHSLDQEKLLNQAWSDITDTGNATLSGDFILDTSTMMVGTTLVVATGTTVATVGRPSIFVSTMGSVGMGTRNPIPAAGLHVHSQRGGGIQPVIRMEDGDDSSRTFDMGFDSNAGWFTDAGDDTIFRRGGTEIFRITVKGADPWFVPGKVTNCNTITPAVGDICFQNSATAPVQIATAATVNGLAPVVWKSTETTGATTAALSTNSPAVTGTAPYVWIELISNDGSKVYVPAWK